jgi:hypothetical protein
MKTRFGTLEQIEKDEPTVVLPIGYIPDKLTCDHKWELYTGLQDKYYYCIKCDEKCECSY